MLIYGERAPGVSGHCRINLGNGADDSVLEGAIIAADLDHEAAVCLSYKERRPSFEAKLKLKLGGGAWATSKDRSQMSSESEVRCLVPGASLLHSSLC
jgi:hypothetical protein